MHDPQSFNFKISTTAPLPTSTLTLFNSVDTFGTGVFRTLGLQRLTLVVEHSHAMTLQFFASTDHGVNWDQVGGDIAVAPPAAGDVGGPWDFDIAPYDDVRLLVTNGADAQTSWRPKGKLHYDRQPGV